MRETSGRGFIRVRHRPPPRDKFQGFEGLAIAEQLSVRDLVVVDEYLRQNSTLTGSLMSP